MPVRRHAGRWQLISALLLAALLGSYVWYEQREPFTHGGSTMGLIYGIVALALMGLLLWFGIRKRSYRSRFGTLEEWLQSHIYLGLFTFAVVIAHTGFQFRDRMAIALLIVVTLVIASGILGAILYKTVPRLLTEVDSNLPADAMSEEMNQLTRSMSRAASGKSAPFQRIYKRLVQEAIPPPLAGWRLLLRSSNRRNPTTRPDDWSSFLGMVPEDEQAELRQLLVLSRQQKELQLRLVAQQKYRNLLDFWLYMHLPLSIAMILLIIAHLWGVFYYGKIQF
ncbi:MAG: hypothetical protein WBX15_08730 [Thermoanaerobaculia bacterium]